MGISKSARNRNIGPIIKCFAGGLRNLGIWYCDKKITTTQYQ